MFNSKPLIFNKVSGDKSLNKPFKTRIKNGQSLEISKSKDYTQSDFRHIKSKRPSNTSSTTNSESSDDDNKPKSKKSLESQSKLSKKYKSKDAPVDYTPNPVLDDFSFSTNESSSKRSSNPGSNQKTSKLKVNKRKVNDRDDGVYDTERTKPPPNRLNMLLDSFDKKETTPPRRNHRPQSTEMIEGHYIDQGSESPPDLSMAIHQVGSLDIRPSSPININRSQKHSTKDEVPFNFKTSILNNEVKNSNKQQHKKVNKSTSNDDTSVSNQIQKRNNNGSKRSKPETRKTNINVSGSVEFDDDDNSPIRGINKTSRKEIRNNDTSTDSDSEGNITIEVGNPYEKNQLKKRRLKEPTPQNAYEKAASVNNEITISTKQPKTAKVKGGSEDDSKLRQSSQSSQISQPRKRPDPKPRVPPTIPINEIKEKQYNQKYSNNKSKNDQSSITSFISIKEIVNHNLCPVCDQELPRFKSPQFKQLLEQFIIVAKPCPRKSNNNAMSAHVLVEQELCSAHELDQKVIPQGKKKGYPSYIDWKLLSKRVIKMKNEINQIIKYRFKSKFWIKAKEEVLKIGLRKAQGLESQFENFEDEQPGYYGEVGLIVISFSLTHLTTSKKKGKKPVIKLDQDITEPLTPHDFIRRVLVPEVSLRLIATDRNVNLDEAEEIRRESRQYGNAMFNSDKENFKPAINISESDLSSDCDSD